MSSQFQYSNKIQQAPQNDTDTAQAFSATKKNEMRSTTHFHIVAVCNANFD